MHTPLFEYNQQKSNVLSQMGEPLLKNFGFQFLAYRRFSLNDNKLFCLINNEKWREVVFSKQYWTSHTFPSLIQNLNDRGHFVNVWPDSPTSSDPIYNLLFELNIWNGIVLYHKTDNYLETFCFVGDKKSNETKNFFVNNMQILEQFSHYFRFTSQRLFEDITDNMLIDVNLSLNQNNNITIKQNDAISNFYDQTDIKKYVIRLNGDTIFLTKREKECLGLMSKNQTTKEAARNLGISPRTVEYYLNQIKLKTGCICTSQLTEIYLQQIERVYGKI